MFLSSAVWGVRAIPNRAVLYGTVMEYCLSSSSLFNIKPEQTLNKLVISVDKVEDMKGFQNMLKEKDGQSVTVYSKEKQSSELFGKRVRTVVEYIGDEKGGIIWIKDIEITQ
jgi:hypothetical protein